MKKSINGVFTTAFPCSAENSPLAVDSMNSTPPFIMPSSPGRDSWEATPNGRVGGAAAVAAPSAVDVADRVRDRCDFSTTRDASRAASFAHSMSSSWRCQRASCRSVVICAASNARLARATSDAKAEWVSVWVICSRELWGCRSVEREEPRGRRWCSAERRKASW